MYNKQQLTIIFSAGLCGATIGIITHNNSIPEIISGFVFCSAGTIILSEFLKAFKS